MSLRKLLENLGNSNLTDKSDAQLDDIVNDAFVQGMLEDRITADCCKCDKRLDVEDVQESSCPDCGKLDGNNEILFKAVLN